MDIVYFAVAAVAVPVLFFMLTWAVVTAYRLLFPEEPRPPEKDGAHRAGCAGRAHLVF